MAEWTHRICERCWFDGPRSDPGDGTFRVPTRVKDWGQDEEVVGIGVCCECGGLTVTGIFFREDENALICKGRHEPAQYHEWSKVQ